MSETDLDQTVANLLEGTESLSIFTRHDLSLITQDVRLLQIYRMSQCQNLAEFLRLGWQGRSQIETYGWDSEGQLKSDLRQFLQHAADFGLLEQEFQLPPPDPALDEQIRQICHQIRLNDRDIKVLRSRLWCRWGERLTLAEIADRMRLSRESVRQIDEDIHDKLHAPPVRERLKALLRDRSSVLRQSLRIEGEDSKSGARFLETQLSANDLFLIRAVHGSIENWLSQSGSTAESQLQPQSHPHPSAGPGGQRQPRASKEHQQRESKPDASARKSFDRMDLRDFTVADLDRLAQLLERKEKLTAEMAEVDAALADFRPGHAAQSGTAPAPGPGPGPGPRPKTEPPKKRQQRGKFKELILAELKTAGREGLSVSELAEKLGTDPKRVHSWYYSVGRKLPNLIKAGRGRIAWQEGEPTGTESPDRSL